MSKVRIRNVLARFDLNSADLVDAVFALLDDVQAARSAKLEVPTGALRRSVPAATAACAVHLARKSLRNNGVGLLREQEAGGSNPLAPTNP